MKGRTWGLAVEAALAAVELAALVGRLATGRLVSRVEVAVVLPPVLLVAGWPWSGPGVPKRTRAILLSSFPLAQRKLVVNLTGNADLRVRRQQGL